MEESKIGIAKSLQIPVENIERPQRKMTSACREFSIGLLLVILIAGSWSGAIQFSKSSLEASHFYAPYFLTWFGTIFMIVCYPLHIFLFLISKLFKRTNRLTIKELFAKDYLIYGHELSPIKAFAIKCLPFLILWLIANYSYSQALGHITTSEASILFSSNCALVCILARMFLADKINLTKILAILLSIGGVVCVCYSEGGVNNFGLLGSLLSILSALAAAMYKVFFKKLVGDATFGQVSLFMTVLGLANLLLAWPIMVGLVVSKSETINFHTAPWGFIIGSSILAFLFNLLLNLGVAVINPLFVSVGMVFGIPLNTIVDLVFRNAKFGVLEWVGGLLILLSVLLIILPWNAMCKPYCAKQKCLNKHLATIIQYTTF